MIIVTGEGVPAVPATVQEAFGLDGVAVPLGGGEGVTVRIGGLVLKRVHDVDEAAWTQALQSRMSEDGFRLARPVPTADGRWTHAGWSAAQFVPGLRPLAPDWQAVVAVGLRFSDAAEAVRDADADVLGARAPLGCRGPVRLGRDAARPRARGRRDLSPAHGAARRSADRPPGHAR